MLRGLASRGRFAPLPVGACVADDLFARFASGTHRACRVESGGRGRPARPTQGCVSLLLGWIMDIEAVLSAVDSWPAEDRIQLMEVLWDRLNDQGFEPEVDDELKAKVDRRLAALDAEPGDVTTWEDIKQYARRPR
jgi:putative addiction module component (TIGR02574 family)